jgi:hypothetical protein
VAGFAEATRAIRHPKGPASVQFVVRAICRPCNLLFGRFGLWVAAIPIDFSLVASLGAVISMSRFSFRFILTISLFTSSSLAVAQDVGKTLEPSSKFLPPSTALYLEVPSPDELLSLIFDHPLRAKIESLEPYRAATSGGPGSDALARGT